MTAGATATYTIRLQNDATIQDRLAVTAIAASPGWTVTFSQTSPGANALTWWYKDIVADHLGWANPLLQPGEAIDLRLDVTAPAGPALASTCKTLVTAISNSDITSIDSVQAITTLATPIPGTAPVTMLPAMETHDSYKHQNPAISADGRYVAFESKTVDPPSDNHFDDQLIFLYDRQTGARECVSVDNNGVRLEGGCADAAINADGRYIAFVWSSHSSTYQGRVFLRDRLTATTEYISVGFTNDVASAPAISPDGRYVVFNEYEGRTYLRDRQLGITEYISVNSSGEPADDWVIGFTPAVSADGRYVAFASGEQPGAWNSSWYVNLPA